MNEESSSPFRMRRVTHGIYEKSVEERIAESYRQDEDMMILVFAQWCVNHGLDPAELYRKAYPNQPDNERLARVLELTVPKEEAGEIPDQTPAWRPVVIRK